MSKIAFIYPGQGAQVAGMGKDFYENSSLARQVYDEASEALQLDMKTLCFTENEQLHRTEYTQAALVTTCLAMTRVVTEQGLKPDATAGLSLGEYCAIAAAGGMQEQDAIRLVRTRGILMEQAVPAGTGGMCAVLGMDAERIEQVITPIEGVTIANYNCPGQIVITGEKQALEEVAKQLKAEGARRTMMLNVSGPFHSPYLVGASETLEKELAMVELSPLKVPYYTNVTGEMVQEIEKTKELLARQVASPVRWMQSVEAMRKDGIDTFVEIGPGRTLAGFLKKIDPEAKVYNIAAWKDVEKVIGEQC